ncbi:MAG: phosphatidylinositol phosphodiesterase [Bacteroides sp.]
MNNKRHLILLLTCLLLCCGPVPTLQAQESHCPADTPLADKANWMRLLADTIATCNMVLPGTHDSGAQHGGALLQTQDLDIATQLEAGVRAFDIRLREHKGQLGLYHSHAFQRVYWESDILPTLIGFLKQHPSEWLVVSLKREGGEAADYRRLLSQSLSQEAYTPYFLSSWTASLTLAECRGRILFLHRDEVMERYPGVRSEGWADNATCLLTLRTAQGDSTQVLLQDEYQYKSAAEAPKKQEVILSSLRQMHQPAHAATYRSGISFVSATAYPYATPKQFAKRLNAAVAERIAAEELTPRGILFIDFIGQPGGKQLVEQLIRSNFR